MFEFWIGDRLYGDLLVRKIDDLRKSLLKYGLTQIHKANVKAYKEGGHQGHGGEAWAPLAESTLKRKLKKKKTKILVDTSTMRNSLSLQLEAHTAFRIVVVEGVHTPYAKFHMEGTKRMPARLPVYISPQDLEQFNKSVGADLEKKINGNKGKGRVK